MDLPTLRGERVLLRPLAEDDLDGLIAILAEPAVARWWGPQAEQPDREELLGPEARFAIVVEGALAGWLGCEENTDPMYRSVGLDIFLTTARHGQGLGREALRLAIVHYLERGHHRFTIDPAADNERAIRTYAARRLQARRAHARLRAGRRRHLARRPAHGPLAAEFVAAGP